MKILILNWRDVCHPKSGGAEVVTMEHAKAWVKAGHSVSWLTAQYSGAKQEEFVDGVRIIRHAGSLTVYLFVPFFLLFYGRKYDVIIDEVHGFPFFTPLFTKKPVIVFIHEIAGEIWDFMFPFPKNIIGRLLEASYFRLYRHCLFWTDAPSTVEELVARGIPQDQCTAIPCPITIHTKRGAAVAIKKDKSPTYLFVSRVVRMKGIEEVIKAFSFILRAQPKAQLWIVGGGEEEYVRELKDMIEEYGGVKRTKFFGVVSEETKFRLMAKAHLLLHASVKEGWGLVVLEAAYVGTPSVVYNVPGLCDVVKNGQTGIVIPNNSPHEMATETLRLYTDKKRYTKYQKNGKLWVASLRWDDAKRQSLSLLTRAVKE